MANYNRIILAGNLTRDPQLSYLPSSTPVAEFGLAINRRWRSQDGQNREETCFIDCRAYGKQGETINQYVSKGRPLMIEGRLQFQQWTSQDGSKRSKHIVVVDQFQFIDGRRDESAGPPAPRQSRQQNDGGITQAEQEAPVPADNDIPF